MSTLAPLPPAAQDRDLPAGDALLEVCDLTVDYLTPRGPARAVDNVSFSIAPGEIFGLAGESGCGKTTVAFAITRLIKPPGLISGGRIRFRGRDVLAFGAEELRAFRWSKVSIVFQSALNALNPVIPIGAQIADAILAHQRVSKAQAAERAVELLTMVGIDPRRRKGYP